MSTLARQHHTRRAIAQARGVLFVWRCPVPQPPVVRGQPTFIASDPAEGPEILLAVWRDGSVTGLCGHVDLGTGLRTALTQIVAEELDVPMQSVHLIMGSTESAPNQGATIASASIQIHAEPLRRAAAQARHHLSGLWAQAWSCQADQVQWHEGRVSHTSHSAPCAEVIPEAGVRLELNLQVSVKDPANYRLVGRSMPRVDIPSKASGEPAFVHDLRWPGVLHGRVVRPPYAGADHGDFIGHTLLRVDQASVGHIPNVRAVVVQGDFVGVVADREEHAEQAMRDLRLDWKPWPRLPDVSDLENALRANPSTPRQLVDEGDVDAAIGAAGTAFDRTYIWPYQMHASLGPSCALAHWLDGADPQASHIRLRVWAGTQNPHVLRHDLATLMQLQDTEVDVIRMEAAGCYGRNGADDVAADAALMSRAVGAPVRVQLTREQESAWEPKGAAQWMHVRGGLGPEGRPQGYDFETAYPSNGAPTLALLLTGRVSATAQAYEMGDRTARPPYGYADLRVTVHDMAPMLRASWLRGVSALPNSFAHESYIDELAHAAGVDPVQYRLQWLDDPRARELVQATAERAGWRPHTQPQQQARQGDWLQGQGFAYARYVHSKWPGFGAAWAAWVADVEVHRHTGEVHVKRVVVGHDAGLTINPAGVEHQIHGNVIQTTSRALKEQVQTDPDTGVVTSNDWGLYPILSFREVPVIEVLQMPRPDQPSLGAGESSSVPGTAAIANAIFDATGVRFRQPPFTPEVVRAALNPLPSPETQAPTAPPAEQVDAPQRTAARPSWRGRTLTWGRRVTGMTLGALALVAATLGWRSSLPEVARPDISRYSDAQLERGRQLAALGNCVGCHTAEQGVRNAGGRPIETPFGTVYTTNLTPDPETGLGRWSFQAFARAMREGVSRDGHRLYPAFPYTSFAGMSDTDLMDLYGHLMAQTPVRQATPAPEMHGWAAWRPIMAVWNGLFHLPQPYRPDPSLTEAQNRGAYAVQSIGHCGACHTPRNVLGAEREAAQLQGADVDGWHAPALDALNRSAVPWTEESFYLYLRHGHSPWQTVAGGPMALIVREMQSVPDAVLRDMAAYLATLNPASAEITPERSQQMAGMAVQRAALQAPWPDAAQRQFQGSCGACHHDGDGPQLLGANTPLALNSQVRAARPDNLIRTILNGLQHPPGPQVGFMPAFRHSLSDAQVTDIVTYTRRRYAPDLAPWSEVVQRVRQSR
ncbi:MAG: molybdopterin-dependent oxidoreductase [Alphaproteobacteria bacterium]|nr:molybdopterin-dependent oxidoreductase [Alphaproteobacteria bacterium]